MLKQSGNKTKTAYINKAGKTKDQLIIVSRRAFKGANTRRDWDGAAVFEVATTCFFIEDFIEVGIARQPLSLLG